MKSYIILVTVLCFFLSCKTDDMPSGKEKEEEVPTGTGVVVNSVQITGSAGSYTFNVKLSSPDTGCDQYADWWEVFLTDGTLIYRRILAHSHVNEQPFTRGGGTINIQADDSIYVRGHMNNLGYGTEVFTGTVNSGLVSASIDKELFVELADQAPLPAKCDF